jgi:hypothetical protein
MRKQVQTTLKRTDGDSSDIGLEEFVAELGETATLTDPRKGTKVEADIIDVHIHDGQVDVTFEFDDDGWTMSRVGQTVEVTNESS